MTRRRRRNPAPTGFALAVWLAALLFAAVAAQGFAFGDRTPLLLWWVPTLLLVKVGADLWGMGRRAP